MAKKKNIDEEIGNSVESQTPIAPNEDAVETKSIPLGVDKTLRVFSAHKELWVSPFGGVYISKPTSVQGAILYKNPYYKS